MCISEYGKLERFQEQRHRKLVGRIDRPAWVHPYPTMIRAPKWVFSFRELQLLAKSHMCVSICMYVTVCMHTYRSYETNCLGC